MEIIEATLPLLDQIMEIENESFSSPWTLSDFKSALASDNTTVFALVDGDIVVGFSCLLTIDYEAEILNIAIRQKYRKNGYGKLLIDHMIALCKESSVLDVFLEVRESNVPARTLYNNSGFEEIGVRKRYYTAPIEDAILMKKTLH